MVKKKVGDEKVTCDGFVFFSVRISSASVIHVSRVKSKIN